MKQKKTILLSFLITAWFVFGACSDNDEKKLCDTVTTVDIAMNSTEDIIQGKFADIGECSVVKFAEGTYSLKRRITISKDMVAIQGAGMDKTILDFAGATVENGIWMSDGDNVGVHNLTIMNTKGNSALRVENSSGVVISNVKVDWDSTMNGTQAGVKTNGAYGIYPIGSENILVDNVTVYGASDAGIYVGSSKNVVVQSSTAKWNVAGVEIENTENALVTENTVENNTGGLVVFDLPGNKILGRKVRLVNNQVQNNNTPNFCNSGTVCQIPSGAGTFILASRDVELSGNTYTNNNGTDLAILNGLSLEPDPTKWLTTGGFRTENIYIKGNTFGAAGSGDAFAPGDAQPLGQAIQLLRIAQNAPGMAVAPDNPGKHMQAGAILISAAMPPSIPTIVVDGVLESDVDNNLNYCIQDNMDLTGLFNLNLPMTSTEEKITKLGYALVKAAMIPGNNDKVTAFLAAESAQGLPNLMQNEALEITYTLKGQVKNLDTAEVDSRYGGCEAKTLSLPSLSDDVNKIISELLDSTSTISLVTK